MLLSLKFDLNLVTKSPTALNALSDSTEVAGIEDKARYSLSKDSDLFLLISNAENSCFKASLNMDVHVDVSVITTTCVFIHQL